MKTHPNRKGGKTRRPIRLQHFSRLRNNTRKRVGAQQRLSTPLSGQLWWNTYVASERAALLTADGWRLTADSWQSPSVQPARAQSAVMAQIGQRRRWRLRVVPFQGITTQSNKNRMWFRIRATSYTREHYATWLETWNVAEACCHSKAAQAQPRGVRDYGAADFARHDCDLWLHIAVQIGVQCRCQLSLWVHHTASRD